MAGRASFDTENFEPFTVAPERSTSASPGPVRTGSKTRGAFFIAASLKVRRVPASPSKRKTSTSPAGRIDPFALRAAGPSASTPPKAGTAAKTAADRTMHQGNPRTGASLERTGQPLRS